ncbi:MAG TPA: alpha/beta hydrolase [bacterium]|nr:alpha/beta hydrolase [bacterium]
MSVDATAQELDLEVGGGRLHALRRGPVSGEAVLCLPGLTANARSFDLIGDRLAAEGFRPVALDLRGRGRSDLTGPGTYGWPAHARDVLDAADRLGAAQFAVVGWSMGAFVAMQAAALAPGRITRAVLVDACGQPPADAIPLIQRAVDRLGVVHPSVERYLELLRGLGTIAPWHPLWDAYFRYELVETGGGVRARTSREAVLEDLAYGERHDPRALWPALTMPVLLLLALRPLIQGGPGIVAAEDRERFVREVPGAAVVAVDANHYGIATHPATPEAIAAFLRGRSM